MNKESLGICPKCGKQIKENNGCYFCEDKNCGVKIYKNILGANISINDLNKLLNGDVTDTLNMVSASKGKSFKAKLKLKSDFSGTELIFEKETTAAKTSIGKCPKCGASVVVINGPYGEYYKCESCTFKINGVIAGKKISESVVQKLLTDNVSDLISGFTSKQNKPFSAYLIIENGDIKFKFQER